MSDKTFERSLTGLTALVLVWIVLGIVLGVMAWGLVVMIGLVIEIGVGGLCSITGVKTTWKENSEERCRQLLLPVGSGVTRVKGR
jgi:hypothetical protein